MSKRKQATIEAGRLTTIRQQGTAETENQTGGSQWQKLLGGKTLAAIGIGLLVTLAAIGATVGKPDSSLSEQTLGQSGSSWLGGLLAPSAPAAPSAPLPTPSPTPQLSKEYIYAGGRVLAVEDAGASSSSTQPTDLVVWRPSSGMWYIKDSGKSGEISTGVFGAPDDKPVAGDFDGDGLSDFAVFRPSNGTWYVQPNGGGSFYAVQFGLSSDAPAPADYDGDGRADIAVWRSGANALFIILKSSTNTAEFVGLGTTGDKPVSADYDGDGRADAAVYRSADATWHLRQSSDGQLKMQPFGDGALDVPVPGDYNGDGKVDLAVRRNSANQWYYLQEIPGGATTTLSFTGGVTMQSTDVSVQGDYDGDGKTDAAVWRPSNGYWHIYKSGAASNPLRLEQWGMNGDLPIAAPMKR